MDGDLYTFGESEHGRLGLHEEQLADHRVPQRVQGILGRAVRVCCGGEHTVVLTGNPTPQHLFLSSSFNIPFRSSRCLLCVCT